MGKIINDGIKKAEERLKLEQQRQQQLELQQQQEQAGLISYIPIVGSVWNWWSPHKPTNPNPVAPHSVTSFNLISSQFEQGLPKQ
jgi:hypothetical protein